MHTPLAHRRARRALQKIPQAARALFHRKSQQDFSAHSRIPLPEPQIPLLQVSLKDPITIKTSSSEIKSQYNLAEKVYYIDFYSSVPIFSDIEIGLGNNVKVSKKIFFAPNCKTDALYCLTNQKQSWWYINSLVRDKIRYYFFKENQE